MKAKICTAQELAAYLIYRYGGSNARVKMKDHLYYQCKQRAEELREALS